MPLLLCLRAQPSLKDCCTDLATAEAAARRFGNYKDRSTIGACATLNVVHMLMQLPDPILTDQFGATVLSRQKRGSRIACAS